MKEINNLVITKSYSDTVSVGSYITALFFYTCYGWNEDGETHVQSPACPFEKEYEVADRVAQMIIMPYPKIEWEEVEDLSETERSSGGYGSTGLK